MMPDGCANDTCDAARIAKQERNNIDKVISTMLMELMTDREQEGDINLSLAAVSFPARAPTETRGRRVQELIRGVLMHSCKSIRYLLQSSQCVEDGNIVEPFTADVELVIRLNVCCGGTLSPESLMRVVLRR